MSDTRILSSVEGVVLTEENTNQPGGLVAVAYTVTSARTAEVWRSEDLDAARVEFDSEVKRSREANNNSTNT